MQKNKKAESKKQNGKKKKNKKQKKKQKEWFLARKEYKLERSILLHAKNRF